MPYKEERYIWTVQKQRDYLKQMKFNNSKDTEMKTDNSKNIVRRKYKNGDLEVEYYSETKPKLGYLVQLVKPLLVIALLTSPRLPNVSEGMKRIDSKVPEAVSTKIEKLLELW